MQVSSILNLLGNEVKKDTLNLVAKPCCMYIDVPISTNNEEYYRLDRKLFFARADKICIIDNAVYLEHSGIIDCIEADHICSIHLKNPESVGS